MSNTENTQATQPQVTANDFRSMVMTGIAGQTPKIYTDARYPDETIPGTNRQLMMENQYTRGVINGMQSALAFDVEVTRRTSEPWIKPIIKDAGELIESASLRVTGRELNSKYFAGTGYHLKNLMQPDARLRGENSYVSEDSMATSRMAGYDCKGINYTASPLTPIADDNLVVNVPVVISMSQLFEEFGPMAALMFTAIDSDIYTHIKFNRDYKMCFENIVKNAKTSVSVGYKGTSTTDAGWRIKNVRLIYVSTPLSAYVRDDLLDMTARMTNVPVPVRHYEVNQTSHLIDDTPNKRTVIQLHTTKTDVKNIFFMFKSPPKAVAGSASDIDQSVITRPFETYCRPGYVNGCYDTHDPNTQKAIFEEYPKMLQNSPDYNCKYTLKDNDQVFAGVSGTSDLGELYQRFKAAVGQVPGADANYARFIGAPIDLGAADFLDNGTHSGTPGDYVSVSFANATIVSEGSKASLTQGIRLLDGYQSGQFVVAFPFESNPEINMPSGKAMLRNASLEIQAPSKIYTTDVTPVPYQVYSIIEYQTIHFLSRGTVRTENI